MNYSVDFKAMAAWIGVAVALSSGIYFLTGYNLQNSQGFQISLEEDTAPGELTRLTVMRQDQPVQGANISIDEEFIGTTNSQGIKGFDTPEDNFTVKASKGDVSCQTNFSVEDGSFSSPDVSEGSDNGEESGSSDGSNNQHDSEDTVDSDNGDQPDDGQDDQDQQQDDTTEEISSDFTGLELDEEPLVGELRKLTVYEDGEEVSGVEVTVNGEVIGSTNAGGTISFGVPDSAEISISTDTGLSETFSVVDYTEEQQNQRDDQNDTEDLTTGIELDSDPVSGTTNRIILYDEGDRVSGETVYLDGNELGQTGSNGAIEFEVPLKEQITVTTDYGLGSQTFNVTEDHPEPDITLLNPTDTASFDTPTGTNTDVTFEASVDITESSGTASLMIDGSEAYTQDLSSGTNSISTTQALSSGSHNWQVEVDTPQYNVSSSSRSLTVNEVEVQNGLSLQNNATAGEYNYVRLYDNGEPVEGTDITVNSDSIGNTDSNGEVGFEVPNAQEITVEASAYSSITESVEGYEEVNTPLVYSASIQSPSSGEVQKPFAFEANVDAGLADSYEIKNSNQVFASGSLTENSTNTVSESISPPNGEQTLEFVVKNSQNGNSTSRSVSVDVWEMIQINNPEEDDSLNSNAVSFEFSLAESLSGSYSIIVDGTKLYEDFLNSDLNAYTKELNVDQGSHEAEIKIETSDGDYSRSIGFNVDSTSSKDIELLNAQGDIMQQAEVEWTVDYPTSFWTYLNVNGERLISRSEESGENTFFADVTSSISTGDHEWRVIAKDESSSEIQVQSSTKSFKLVEITRISPDNLNLRPSGTFEFDISTGSDTSAELYINNSLVKESQLSSGDNSFSYTLDNRDPGRYEYTMQVRNEVSNEITNKNRPFEVS